jgi:pyruvyltransferase
MTRFTNWHLFKKPTKIYWWKSKENFGDRLAPLLLQHFSDIKKIEWAPVNEAKIISVGSVLEHLPENYNGYVIGSGKLFEKSKIKINAKILALRGPLTAKSFPGNFALGDPGLLANELLTEYQEKQWDLGIIPHWRDDQLVRKFMDLIPPKFSLRVIYPTLDPLQVIKEISACKRIVTSSLHGMIVADAIGGIPRRFEICDNLKNEGGLFKFHDYSASIHTPLEIGKMQEPSRHRVEDAKFEIYDAYRELKEIYEKTF